MNIIVRNFPGILLKSRALRLEANYKVRYCENYIRRNEFAQVLLIVLFMFLIVSCVLLVVDLVTA